VRKAWLVWPVVLATSVAVVSSYAGAEWFRLMLAMAMVYGVGYVTGSLLIDPKHDRTSLALGVVRLIAGCLLTSIAFLLSLELALPWFSGPLALFALAVLLYRREAFVPPDIRLTLSWDAVLAGLAAVVLLAPPVIAALRMAPGAYPPVFFNVDVPYFLEQVHALVRADSFPPGSLSVIGGRRPYHFGLHALAAFIARGSGIAPHHGVFLVLVPMFAAGIVAAAVVLARAISPAVPFLVAVPLLIVPIPTLWYDFSLTLVETVQAALQVQSFDPFQRLAANWEMWGVSPNIQNLAAHFIVLASLGALANAPVLGWRLPSFLVGSAIVFKSPAGIALAAGFSVALACRAALTRSVRALIPVGGVAVVFALVYGAFWILSPVKGELRAIVSPLFQLAYASSHGGLRWFAYDVIWLLAPALVVLPALRTDPERRSLPWLAFAAGPFIVVNLLQLVDRRRSFGISSMNEDDWRQVILPVPILLHAFVLSVVGRRWEQVGSGLRGGVVVMVALAVIPSMAAAGRYADVLINQPARAHEFADNHAIGEALAVIQTRDTLLVTNDLRYPSYDHPRENRQMQIPALFGHQAFAVNYMYEAYPFSEERRGLQRLLEAEQWTSAIDDAARTYHWTHLLIRKDSPHPEPIPLERVFDNELYSVFRFKPS